MSFGKRLQAARDAKGFTQPQVAAWFGFTTHTPVSQWENDHGMPEASRIPTLCRRLGVSADHLFFGTPNKGDPLSDEARDLARAWDSLPEFLRQFLRAAVFEIVQYSEQLSELVRQSIYGEVPMEAERYANLVRELEDGVAKMRHERAAGSTDDGRRIIKALNYVGPERRGSVPPMSSLPRAEKKQ